MKVTNVGKVLLLLCSGVRQVKLLPPPPPPKKLPKVSKTSTITKTKEKVINTDKPKQYTTIPW